MGITDHNFEYYVDHPDMAEEAVQIWAHNSRRLGWTGAVNIMGALVAVVARLAIRISKLEHKQGVYDASEKQKEVCQAGTNGHTGCSCKNNGRC
jgi:hypothetical protein